MDRVWLRIGLTLILAIILSAQGCGSDERVSDDDDDDTSIGGSGGAVGSNSSGPMTGGAGGMTGSSVTTGGAGGMAGSGGSGGSGPCAGAPVLTLDGNAASGAINPAGEQDYHRLYVTEGDWLGLITLANPNDDPTLLDTVVTVFNADGTQQLAESDDATPRVGTDSELFYHVPQTGWYCVRVMEWSDWAMMTPNGGPSFTYDLYAVALDATLPWFAGDSDPSPSNDTQQTAQPMNIDSGTNGGTFGHIGALLTPGTDVDFYNFTTPAGAMATQASLMPSGPNGHGSTQGPGLVRIRNASGAILAEIDYQLGINEIWIQSSGNTSYAVEVARPNATVGSNDFAYLKVFNALMGNQVETELNGTAAQADVASPVPNGMIVSHFIEGTLSPSSDVDYWSFNATAGSTVSLACGAARSGSGLLGFTATVRNPADTSTLQTETEVATQDILWATGGSMAPLAISQTGTYFFRATATGQKANVIGAQYRCGIHVQ